jgi:hypothetical protein
MSKMHTLAAALLTGCTIRTRRHTLIAALFITSGVLTLTFDHAINFVFTRA